MNLGTHLEDLLWEQACNDLFCTKEEFVASLDGWDLSPVELDGHLAFIVAIRGPRFHFQSFCTGHVISIAMIREHLQPIIDKHGYCETRTPKEDARQRRFNERFGFVKFGEDEYDIHYRIDQLDRSHRSASCQS